MRNPLLHTNSWDHSHHHPQSKKSVSVDDLNDALMEETTDESEAEGKSMSFKVESLADLISI